MGAGSSRDPLKMEVGKTPAQALAILERRTIKCRQALGKKNARALEKASALVHLISTWDTDPSIPPKVLLDAGMRALFVLENTTPEPDVSDCDTEDEIYQRSLEAVLAVSAAVLAFLPRLLALAQRAHGPRSLEAAELLHTLAARESDAENYVQVILWAQQASTILLELRGERFHIPQGQRKNGYYTEFDNAPLLSLCEEGHTDCLELLAKAHSHLPAQGELAHAAAGRHLSLLDQLYGQGHVHTVPGMYSMMWACYGNGEGDCAMALTWANRCIDVLTKASAGAPTVELADAYEQSAYLLLAPGPTHNVGAAERLAAHAASLRKACSGDLSSNQVLVSHVGEWKQRHASRDVDAQGRALAAGALAGLAMGAALSGGGGEGEGGGGGGLLSHLNSAVGTAAEHVGEVGEEVAEEAGSALVQGVGHLVDFLSNFL